jgi:alkylation response protein AidB-like acyl-CoA dehydrogenase
MATISSGQIIEQISRFAAENIATRYDLSERVDFPHDLWEKMAQDGLFKIGIEKFYGGSGGGYLNLTEAAEALVKNGYNMGIATSWLYQQIVARFLISGFGSEEQKKQYLPGMVSGELTASIAVSEPQRGAHPKYITTTAVKDESFYILNGEKTYLTNGPIAGLFIVIAVTEEAEQKKFTAFLVPLHAAGLKVGPPLNLNFLKPSPHGSIVLNNCRLPDTAILGKEGTAYREMVIALGEIEDIVMMGTSAGAMAAQLSLLIRAIGEVNIAATELPQDKLGAQDAALQTIRTIACKAAEELDSGMSHSVSLAITFMNLTAEFQTNMDAIINEWNLHVDKRYNYLISDLAAMMAFKKKITQVRQKKQGQELLKEKR